MIRKMNVEEQELTQVLKIWLDSNLEAHNFIDQRYFRDNYEFVKNVLPQAEVYVYESNHGICGFIGLNENFIEGLFVSKRDRSSKIGTRLLDYVKGIRKELHLHVYCKNEKALHFYQQNNFAIQSENIDLGTGENEYCMCWNAEVRSE